MRKKKPRVVWMTPPCTTQRTHQSQSRSRFHRVQMNILVVFLWLVKQDWCEAILEQMWSSTSLGRGGVFSELKEQFHGGRTPGCQWGSLADGVLSSKSWFFICSHRRWSDLLSSNVGKRNVAVHTAISQDSCKRDHESGILETNSFTDVLVSDD